MGIAFYHEYFRLHSPYPYNHPESPERLDYMLNAVESSGWKLVEPKPSTPEVFRRVHDSSYYEKVMEATRLGEVVWLDPDTYISPGTSDALRALAGSVQDAVNLAARGGGPVIILGRPPGHHAGKRGPALGAPTLGFCVFNASALAALLLYKHGKVLVLDFDAHHGNGTQEILWDEQVVHVDIHQDPATIYPGTGFPEEVGGVKSHPKVNIVIPSGSGDDIFEDVLGIVRNVLEWYDPDYLVVSAGFDAFNEDTVFTGLMLAEPSFNALGMVISEYSDRMVIIVEGGYTIGLDRGLRAFLSGIDKRRIDTGEPIKSSEWVWRRYEILKKRLKSVLSALGVVVDN